MILPLKTHLSYDIVVYVPIVLNLYMVWLGIRISRCDTVLPGSSLENKSYVHPIIASSTAWIGRSTWPEGTRLDPWNFQKTVIWPPWIFLKDLISFISETIVTPDELLFYFRFIHFIYILTDQFGQLSV